MVIIINGSSFPMACMLFKKKPILFETSFKGTVGHFSSFLLAMR